MNGRSGRFEILVNVLRSHSNEQNDIPKILDEWRIEDSIPYESDLDELCDRLERIGFNVYSTGNSHICHCTCNQLQNVYVIVHRTKDIAFVPIGSVCIQRFGNKSFNTQITIVDNARERPTFSGYDHYETFCQLYNSEPRFVYNVVTWMVLGTKRKMLGIPNCGNIRKFGNYAFYRYTKMIPSKDNRLSMREVIKKSTPRPQPQSVKKPTKKCRPNGVMCYYFD